MIADTSPEPVTLVELLTGVARRATNRQLIAMTATGFAGAVALVLLLGRPGWIVGAAAFGIGAYGAWGIADRALNALWSVPGSPRGRVNSLRFARAVAAVAATLAAVTTLAAMFIPMFGFWRS